MNKHVAPMVATEAERLEIVSSSERLSELEHQWTQLWQASDALIFQSHGWISAWWNTLKSQNQVALRVGLVWSGDRLVAVVPLAITRRKGLRFLEWAAAAYTDYGDILRAPDCTDAALARVWTQIRQAGGYDLVFINRLLPDAAAWRLFDPETKGGAKLRPNHREEISSRMAGDWNSGAAWFASHPKKVRHNHRRSIRILEEAGTVQFRLLGHDEPLGPVLQKLALLKRKWLERTGRSVSELFDESAEALPALVDVLARAGILRLFVIEVNGLVAAISVNFVQRDTMMAWVTTYDPDYARASPGMVLIFEYVQWSFDHGLKMVDLLCGGEAFKDRLATHTVALQSLMGTGSAKGSLALLADNVRRKFRQKTEKVDAEPAEETSA